MTINSVKTSELSAKNSLNETQTYFVILDTNNLTQGINGSTVKAPGSALSNMVWSKSANYNLQSLKDLNNIVSTNSARQWNYQGTDIQPLTANWQATYNTVGNFSANWGIDFDSQILIFNPSNNTLSITGGNTVNLSSLANIPEIDPIFTSWANTNSANFVDMRTIVSINSATNWNYQGTDIKSLTSNWQNTYTSYASSSAFNKQWESSYVTVNTLSSTWGISSPISQTYNSTITPNVSTGLYRRIAMTGDITLNAPVGTLVDGMKWRGRFTADSSMRTLNLNAAIKIPSASTFTGSKSIAANEMWLVQIEYSNDLSAWCLQVLEGGWV